MEILAAWRAIIRHVDSLPENSRMRLLNSETLRAGAQFRQVLMDASGRFWLHHVMEERADDDTMQDEDDEDLDLRGFAIRLCAAFRHRDAYHGLCEEILPDMAAFFCADVLRELSNLTPEVLNSVVVRLEATCQIFTRIMMTESLFKTHLSRTVDELATREVSQDALMNCADTLAQAWNRYIIPEIRNDPAQRDELIAFFNYLASQEFPGDPNYDIVRERTEQALNAMLSSRFF